jgi:hypothetical protein
VNRIYVPACGVENWKALLADPEKQWRKGFSARALAHCWQKTDGFPSSVRAVFDASPFPLFHGIEMLLGFPEHKVPLPGGHRASQTDLFVLARSRGESVSIAVEGKVDESFGLLVREWFVRPSAGKRERLNYLCRLLGLSQQEAQDLRYQLLHRTASALIEAWRFNARHALMLVHSFSRADPASGFDDYEKFGNHLGCVSASPDSLSFGGRRAGIDFYLGWVKGEAGHLTS